MLLPVERYVTGPIGTNTYLIWDEATRAAAIVDPAEYAPKIAASIEAKDLSLAYILLTHGHGDHIGGVAAFQHDFPAVKVVAGEKERELLTDATLNASEEMFGRPITVDADLWVHDGDVLFLGEMPLTFLETPGHTQGGMSIYGGGMVFSGDTLFCRSVGRTDFYGGDFPTLQRSVREVLYRLPDETVVLPGHMEPTTIGEEKRGNPFV